MNSIIIKQAKADDLPRIKYITRLAYKIPFEGVAFITKPHESENEDRKFLNKEISILTASFDGKIVGSVRYKFDQSAELNFFKLAVLKTYRGRKIGATLIVELEKIAKKKRCKKITLDCAKEKKLDEYYKKFSYKVDRIENKNSHHVVYMSKDI